MRKFLSIKGALIAAAAFAIAGTAAVAFAVNEADVATTAPHTGAASLSPAIARESAIFHEAQASGEQGVVLVSLDSAGPAAKAGMLRGDIVLKVDGAEINDARALSSAVSAKKPGDKVNIEFTRGGAAQTLDVTLGDRAGRAYLGVSPAAAKRAMPAMGRAKPFTRTMPFSGSLPFGGRMPFSGTFAISNQVISVTAGSPAEKAGVQPGDMLLTVDDASPDMRNPLGRMLESRKPGDVVRLAVQRGEQKLALVATLAARPDGKAGGWLGISYAPRMAGFDRKLPQPGNANRVRVAEVVTGSPAEKAGLAAGDVIAKVDGGDVAGVRAFQQAVAAKKPGDALKLTVERGGVAREIAVTLGESPSDKTKGYMGVRLAGGPQDNSRPGNGSTPGQRGPAPQARPASNL